jgi:hypothetical protein
LEWVGTGFVVQTEALAALARTRGLDRRRVRERFDRRFTARRMAEEYH